MKDLKEAKEKKEENLSPNSRSKKKKTTGEIKSRAASQRKRTT